MGARDESHPPFPDEGPEDERRRVWERLARIRVTCVEKHGKCGHEVGDAFEYRSPYHRPSEACHALLQALDPYTWRVIFGFPSWEADDPTVYRIHCPSRRGTVWEMRRVDAEQSGGRTRR